MFLGSDLKRRRTEMRETVLNGGFKSRFLDHTRCFRGV